MSDDGVDRSLAAFLRDFGEPSGREVIGIDVTGQMIDNPDDTRPLILVRHGDTVALIDILPLASYLDIDVHAFHAGELGAVAGMGMTVGRGHTMFDHPTGIQLDSGSGVKTAVVQACLFIGRPA